MFRSEEDARKAAEIVGSDDAVAERKSAEAKRQDEQLHEAAVAQAEQDKAEKRRKEEEQKAVGTHAVNPKIKEKWDESNKIEGNANVIVLPDGSKLRGHYVLTEAGAATASHDASNGFEPTEGFPVDENGQSVNDRDYSRDKDAQRMVDEMANGFDSRALQSPVIVSQDGVVLSGNNRTMSGDIAAKQGTDKAYVDHLREFGQMYGFAPEQIDGMQHPRVVFVPDEPLPYDAATFARFNAETQKRQRKPEHAVKLGKIVPDNVFGSIATAIGGYDMLSDFYADSNAVNEVLKRLFDAGVINEMQLPELRTGNALSAAGKELIENLLVGKAFQGAPDAVRQLIAEPNVKQAVVMALSEIAHNRTLEKSGYSLGKELAAAIDLVYRARKSNPDMYKNGVPVSPFGRQLGLFDGQGDQAVTDGAVLLLADLLSSGKTSDLRKVLAAYNAEATESASGQADIFSGKVLSKEEILKTVTEHFKNATRGEQKKLVDAAVDKRKQAAAERGGRGKESEQTEHAAERGEKGGSRKPAGEGTAVDGGGRQDGSVEANTNKITPVGESDLGFVYDQFRGDAQGAIKQLIKMQDGEALGALHHDEIGDIDLVWGKAGTSKSDGYGLAKLVKFHPEVLDNLQEILDGMHVTKRTENRVQLESDEYQAAVRLTWNGDEKIWLLTAFKKRETSEPTNSRTDVDSNHEGMPDDTAPRQSSDVSASKDSASEAKQQEGSGKSAVAVKEKPKGGKGGGGYSISPTTYTNKKGKTTDMSLLKFDNELTPEQERAVKEFAKERTGEGRFAPTRGWKDRESGGWMFRSEEDARKAAEMVGGNEAKTEQAETKQDNQGNPLNADGTLKLEKVTSVDDLTDEDFSAPTRNVELPTLPKNVDDAIGANGKPVVIKKNIFERNAERHSDLTAEDSRNILMSALFSPNLYGQNQKAKRPYNWVVINTKDEQGKNRLVLLEINPNKNNIEIIHWQYARDTSLEQIKRQAENEGGQILILPSDTEEAGGLSSLIPGLSSESKDTTKSVTKQPKADTKQLDEAIVKAEKDRESGSWMFRSEEDARKAAEMVGSDEAEGEPKPVGKGLFGNIHDQFKGKVKEAVEFLMKHKSGDLLGVFHRSEVGDIDLVWGDDDKGLQHIINGHILVKDPDFKNIDEAIFLIDDIVKNGKVVKEGEAKIVFEKDGYRVVICKNINGKQKNWVLTSYDSTNGNGKKKERLSDSTTLVTPDTNEGCRAVASSDNLSEGKDSTSEADAQEGGGKSAVAVKEKPKKGNDDGPDGPTGGKGKPKGGKGGKADGGSKPSERKIDDVGEHIAGARKDALAKLSQSVADVTLESLIGLPASKAFKRPDLKKAVKEGALRETDARFAEAVMAAYLGTAKPKLKEGYKRASSE
ncbi:MAG: hypothetical protein SO000_01395, partial [Sodaliphilus sp.]|nr:hypothetical protein [Sodaliphilus sp.]